MKNLNVIIGNGQPLDTLSKDITKWRISKGKLAAHLIFFNRVSYYSGYISNSDLNYLKNRRDDPNFFDYANTIWKLQLPEDHSIGKNALVVPIFSFDPYVSVAQATIEKMEEGFTSVSEENWVCHPEAPRTDAAALNRHPFAPTINMEFLDGLVCPPDSADIEEVLNFRN